LEDFGETVGPQVLSIPGEDFSIGSDAAQAVIQLDEPSVEPLHARFTLDMEGTFLLEDEHSISGTWINYTPVPKAGVKVEHDDLIHFGRNGFRFTYIEPKSVPRLVILEEDWRR
jgi:pSer/pThr/pTyr-binding forkhead associated (FHA) protein